MNSQILETWSPLLESELELQTHIKCRDVKILSLSLNESANFSMLGMPPAGNIAGLR